MKFFTICALALFSLVATPAISSEMSKTFVVVTSADTETQGMAMILSMQALKNGSKVRILLCGPAGELANKDVQSEALKPLDKSPKQIMMGLMKQGVTVEVCALYLPNRGLMTSDLLEGVGLAKPPAIGSYMADPAVRYFTF